MCNTDAKLFAAFLIVLGLAACDQQPSTTQSAPNPSSQLVNEVSGEAEFATAANPNAIAVNTICPVSGDKIDPDGRKASYKGQIYGFCCDDCMAAFMANPDKYTAAR